MEQEEKQDLVRELTQPLYAGKGWLTFLGVCVIISGVFAALSIIGILYAWLPIWMGVLLLQAGNALDTARNNGDQAAMMRAMGKLKTYFIICGVTIIVTLALYFLFFLFALSMGVMVDANTGAAI